MTTATTSPSRLAEAAVHYAERGWYVFPLHHPVGGNCSCGVADCSNAGKHPRFAGGFHEATTDIEQVRTWWGRWPDANIGLAPGPSKLVVIDVDGPDGEAAAEKLGLFSEPTWNVTTGRVEGGRHLYFRHPGNGAVIGNRALAPHVDVRGDNGYAIIPPSLHASGKRYCWGARDTDVPLPLPPRIEALLSSDNGTSPPAEISDTIPTGERNETLASFAGTLRRRGLSKEAMFVQLEAMNETQCDPPLEDREVRAIAASVGRYEPSVRSDTNKKKRGSDKKRLNLSSLADVLRDPNVSREPQAVVPRFCWAGRTTLLAAREKSGKSTTASAGAASMTRGGEFLGGPCKQGVVLWVSVEEHAGDLARRLETFRADADTLYILEYPEDPLQDLERAMDEVKPALVVIDTLPTFVNGIVDDSRSSTDWTPVMSRLTRLARESNAAFLLLHHSRKSDNRYRDSTAIGAGVDVILEMAETEDDATLRKVRTRGRWPMSDFSIRFHGDHFSLGTGELGLETRVHLFIERHPGCSQKALREGVGARAAEVDSALSRLLLNGVVVDNGTGTRHAYGCPEGRPDPVENTPRDEGRDDPREPMVVPRKSLSDKAGTTSGRPQKDLGRPVPSHIANETGRPSPADADPDDQTVLRWVREYARDHPECAREDVIDYLSSCVSRAKSELALGLVAKEFPWLAHGEAVAP